MEIAPALLEDWLRDYYFTSEIDISGSGVEDFSLAELRELTGLKQKDLDAVVFRDSPSCGRHELRRAIAERWGDGDAERVMAANGSSEVLFLILHALLRPGDEVVVLEPAYHSHVHIAESIKCRVKYWQLNFDRGFTPDLEELKRLVTPETRMVVVNFPHNPTGASVTAEEQAEIIRIAADVGAYLVWDSAFAELTYERAPLPDAALLYERAISIGTLSKAYGLPGLRVGWAIASPLIIADCIHIKDYTSLYISPLVELIALHAVEHADVLLQIRLEQARRNRQIVSEWVEGHRGLVEWVPPQGGVTAFVRFPMLRDVHEFCRQLTERHGVLLVPGSCFNRTQHARLGFGGQTSALRQGLIQVSDLLKAHCS